MDFTLSVNLRFRTFHISNFIRNKNFTLQLNRTGTETKTRVLISQLFINNKRNKEQEIRAKANVGGVHVRGVIILWLGLTEGWG